MRENIEKLHTAAIGVHGLFFYFPVIMFIYLATSILMHIDDNGLDFVWMKAKFAWSDWNSNFWIFKLWTLSERVTCYTYWFNQQPDDIVPY